jgi:hypothetical protein
MHVAGSLSLTFACAIVVPLVADVPLHPTINAVRAPTDRSARKSNSYETRKLLTREDLLKLSDSMSMVTFPVGAYEAQDVPSGLDLLVSRCSIFNARYCNIFHNSGLLPSSIQSYSRRKPKFSTLQTLALGRAYHPFVDCELQLLRHLHPPLGVCLNHPRK